MRKSKDQDKHHDEPLKQATREGNRHDEPREQHGGDTVTQTLADDAASLVKQLQTERDQAVEGRLRALADFRNYQRRALESEQRASESGAARVVRAVLPVVDNFDLMLAQKVDQMSVEQLLGAVRMVREELSKALQTQGVEPINPKRGEPFDPNRHEAMLRQPADDLEPNSVVATMQPGYAMGEMVLRPAKVSVAPSRDEE
jgi:molecular chaperone GrpE